MAHNLENATALIDALESPGRSTALFPQRLEIARLTSTLDFDTIARSVYDYLNAFASLIARKISVSVGGESFDTTNYYHTPESQMMVFSLKPADQTPVQLPSQAVSRLGILDMYHTVDLTDQELAKIIIEKRPTITGHTIEALVKSHGLTPDSITARIAGSTPIIGHPVGRPNEDYTTIKLMPLENETSQSFVDRVNQAIETTAAGIIAQSQSLNRQARQNLALAA